MDRIEGMNKLTGQEMYLSDTPMADALWVMTVRSPAPRGQITGIKFANSINWNQFIIVDYRDIPGHNEVRLIALDQPVLASDYVRHIHEPVLLIAHRDRNYLRHAVNSITISVDEDEPIFDYRVQPAASQIQYNNDNCFRDISITKGDTNAVWGSAAHIVDGIYETGPQEHVYLETNGVEAYVDNGVVTVRGSMQCPYYVLNALMHSLNCKETDVRVIQTPTGGGFGGKEDVPSMLAIHVALVAINSGQRVRMLYDRDEDIAATTKRHPCQVYHQTALDREGIIIARKIDILMDGGAYVTLSPVVLSRGILHAVGPYRCENVSINGRTMLTNTVPFGAFRGFGAPQTLFACERHIDRIAKSIGMDPIELRCKNYIKQGETTSTGQMIRDNVNLENILDKAIMHSEYYKKHEEYIEHNKNNTWIKKGIGVASIYHGSGFTGSGERELKSKVRVVGLNNGDIEVRTSNTEIGQGLLTVFTQIASERLCVNPSSVKIISPDTHKVPNSGPTVASRSVMVVGHLIERACDALMAKIVQCKSDKIVSTTRAIIHWHTLNPDEVLDGIAVYQTPPGISWDDKKYKGDAYSAYAWATYVAEVEIDMRTFRTQVIDFTAIQEIGKVINETLAKGQIQGGVVQGIGWALYEQCKYNNGAMQNCSLADYTVPTSDDVPSICVSFLEEPYAYGAQGAKGIGELPMDGPAPAIANAIAHALDVEPNTIPLTPERVMDLMNHDS